MGNHRSLARGNRSNRLGRRLLGRVPRRQVPGSDPGFLSPEGDGPRRRAISSDAGRTWREAGGGLPPGFAVAVDDDDADRMLFAARNRLYLSENGGIFWRALVPELPDIQAVDFS